MLNKELLKEGDIILFHTKGFSPISMAIRILTQSFFNHVGLYVIDLDLKGYVIEASGKVIKTPVETYLGERKYILKVVRVRQEAFRDANEYKEGISTAISRIRAKIGASYDTWAIVWLGIVFVIKGTYKKVRQYIPIGNPLQKRDSFFCSEIIAEVFYKTSSISKYPNLFAGKKFQEPSTTTPRDIAKSENVFMIAGIDKL
jgi:hypothetical protein